MRPHREALGWAPAAGEGDDVRALRGLLIVVAGGLGADPEAWVPARQVLEQATADPASVDQEVHAAVVAVVAALGTAEEFDCFVERWRHASTPQEEQRFLYSLCDFPDPDLVRRAVALAFSDEVRPQNAPLMLARTMANRTCAAAAWAELRTRWDDLVERFAPALAARNIFGAARWITDEQVVADMVRTVRARPLPAAMRTVEQHLERQRVRGRCVPGVGPGRGRPRPTTGPPPRAGSAPGGRAPAEVCN